MSAHATIHHEPTTTTQTAPGPMRAVLQAGYGGAEVLSVGVAPRPTPGEREVLVAVAGAAIDRGTWHLMTGRPYLMRLMGFGFRAPKQPIPGIDVAGTVVAVGAKVTRFKPGDRVFGIGNGTHAEFTCASEDKLALAPEKLPLAEAAVLGVSALTALQALTEAGKLARGERVLILGASGGVGTFAVQIARALGAHVTGVCSASKLELVRSLGAEEVIDYRTTDYADGSARYDLILDVGGNTPLSRLRRALTPTGRLVFVGGENGGDWTAGFGRVLGAMLLSPFVKQRFVPFMAREHFSGLERIAEMVQAGEVRPVIDRRVPLAGVAEALRELEAGRVRGKIAVSVAE